MIVDRKTTVLQGGWPLFLYRMGVVLMDKKVWWNLLFQVSQIKKKSFHFRESSNFEGVEDFFWKSPKCYE